MTCKNSRLFTTCLKHGVNLRVLLNDFKKMSSTNKCQEDNLVAVVQIFRHGQRTPLSNTYPTDPYDINSYWPPEPMMLTNEGKRQMFNLGQYTRQRYQCFLPSLYLQKHFSVYTSNHLRSIVSAQLYASGLFMPTDKDLWHDDIKWNPIPTLLADPPVLRSYPISFCPPFRNEFKVILNALLEEFNKDPMADYILTNTGITDVDYFKLSYFHEALTTQNHLGMKLPEWTEKIFPGIDYHYNFLEALVSTDSMKTLYVGPLLNDIIEFFEDIAKHSSGPKLVAYSGHDSNLVSILSTLGAYERHHPTYASSLFFELRKQNGEHYINIFYKNNDVVPITLAGAEFNCKLSEFKNILSKYFITREEFYVRCKNE